MSILSMRSKFLLPNKELIINKNITIQQKPTLIASLTEQEGIIKLWIFQHVPDLSFNNVSEEYLRESTTNRDDITRHTLQISADCGFISEIRMQGIALQPTQSSSSVMSYNSPEYMKLQHFLEAGVDFSSIENVSFDELVLTEYQLAEGTSFPEIDTATDMCLSLKIGEKSREVLLEPSHLFNLEIGNHDKTASFIDSSNGDEIEYHISELVCYDMRAETMKQFQDVEMLRKLKEHGHDDAAIEKMKADMPNSLNQICPEGHALLILMYESSKDVQLNFYTTEFLSAKPEHNGCAAIGLFHSNNEKSKFGNQIRSCLLKTVPVGFNNAVEVELMSWYKKIPSETIDIS